MLFNVPLETTPPENVVYTALQSFTFDLMHVKVQIKLYLKKVSEGKKKNLQRRSIENMKHDASPGFALQQQEQLHVCHVKPRIGTVLTGSLPDLISI